MTLNYSKKYVLVPYERFLRMNEKSSGNFEHDKTSGKSVKKIEEVAKEESNDAEHTPRGYLNQDTAPPLPSPPNKVLHARRYIGKVKHGVKTPYHSHGFKRVTGNGWHIL